MEQCFHCGAHVQDEPQCWNCGQSLDIQQIQSPTSPSNDDRTDQATNEGDEKPHDEQPQSDLGFVPPRQKGQLEDSASAEQDPSQRPDEEIAPSPAVGEGRKISRRSLLAGAGLSVGLLGAGAVGWTILGSEQSEERALAESYVDAVANNDWEGARELYHNRSPINQAIESSDQFDSYEGMLERQGTLELWERIRPTLGSVQVVTHIPDLTAEAVEEVGIRVDPEDAGVLDAGKLVAAYISVDVDAFYDDTESASQYYENGKFGQQLQMTMVSADGEWSLWLLYGAGRFGQFQSGR